MQPLCVTGGQLVEFRLLLAPVALQAMHQQQRPSGCGDVVAHRRASRIGIVRDDRAVNRLVLVERAAPGFSSSPTAALPGLPDQLALTTEGVREAAGLPFRPSSGSPDPHPSQVRSVDPVPCQSTRSGA